MSVSPENVSLVFDIYLHLKVMCGGWGVDGRLVRDCVVLQGTRESKHSSYNFQPISLQSHLLPSPLFFCGNWYNEFESFLGALDRVS